jgi:hypothetical protein
VNATFDPLIANGALEVVGRGGGLRQPAEVVAVRNGRRPNVVGSGLLRRLLPSTTIITSLPPTTSDDHHFQRKISVTTTTATSNGCHSQRLHPTTSRWCLLCLTPINRTGGPPAPCAVGQNEVCQSLNGGPFLVVVIFV